MKYMIQLKTKRIIKAHDEEEAVATFFDEIQELYDAGELSLTIRKAKNDEEDDEDESDDEED